ncbi:MAG: hypothetical protein H7831_17865 [Magnetococcus sp. WYHC-3]
MPCYSPLNGYKSRELTANGKRKIVFSPREGFYDLPVTISCGQCIGCRLEKSRQWAMRCVHEASMHENNCFITLTYDEKNLPKNKSLEVEHFQKFMKRLRFKFGEGIRFFHCGEYGERFGRPHYHAVLFNFDFKDKSLWKEERGVRLFVSEALSELWPFGFSTIGEMTFESAAYVARYVLKKQSGKNLTRYLIINPETGEIIGERKPEYTTMSRRPGVGKMWFEKYKDDVYPSDEVVIRGKVMKPPKFYDKILELTDPTQFKKIKASRTAKGYARKADSTPERLKVRETVKKAQLKSLKRGLDNEI